MAQPLVSVIVPTYNRAPFVEETLQSVLGQTFTDYELIVSDDCSTDGTLEILRQYRARHPDRIRLLEADENQGVASNVNRLLDEASGKYIAYLDSDDVWLPEKLSVQTTYMEARPECAMSFHDVDTFDSTTGRSVGLVSERVGYGPGSLRGGAIERLFDLRIGSHMVSHMYRAAAVGDTRFDERLHDGFDYLFRIEVVAKGGDVGAINQVLAKARQHYPTTSQGADGNRSRALYHEGRGFREMQMVFAVVEARYPHLFKHMLRMKKNVAVHEVARCVSIGDINRGWHIALNGLRGGLGPKGLFAFVLLRLAQPFRRNIDSQSALVRALAKRLYRG